MVVVGTGLVGTGTILADTAGRTIRVRVATYLETLNTGEITVWLADGILGSTEGIASIGTFRAATGIVDDGGRRAGGAMRRRVDVAAALGTLDGRALCNETGFTVFMETRFNDPITAEGIGAVTGIITETVL